MLCDASRMFSPLPTISWVLFAVLSAVFLGLYDVAKKASVQDNAVLVVLFACSACGMALLLPLGVLSLAAPAWAPAGHGGGGGAARRR